MYQVYINQDYWYRPLVEAILPEHEDDGTGGAAKGIAQDGVCE